MIQQSNRASTYCNTVRFNSMIKTGCHLSPRATTALDPAELQEEGAKDKKEADKTIKTSRLPFPTKAHLQHLWLTLQPAEQGIIGLDHHPEVTITVYKTLLPLSFTTLQMQDMTPCI